MAVNPDKAHKAKRQYYCIFAVLAIFLIGLQYKLWFSETGFARVERLKTQIEDVTQQNARLIQRNRQIEARLTQWQSHKPAQESLARRRLGMIKDNEVYYQFIDGKNPDQSPEEGRRR